LGRGIAVLVLFYGLTWSFLLLPWLMVGERALTGAELSQVLVSLPAVAILMALIALYRKFPRALILASVASMLLAALIAVLSDFSFAPASLELQESVTGIAGETSLGTPTFWPYVFTATSVVSILLGIWVASLPVSTRVRVDEPGANDVRSIWDEQV
jgi:hypothetical protein